jgi:hypothetical protein
LYCPSYATYGDTHVCVTNSPIRWHSVILALGPAILDRDVAALDEASFLHVFVVTQVVAYFVGLSLSVRVTFVVCLACMLIGLVLNYIWEEPGEPPPYSLAIFVALVICAVTWGIFLFTHQYQNGSDAIGCAFAAALAWG